MSKQFSDVAKISRETARQPRVKMVFKVTSFLTEFNPLLPDLNKLIRNSVPLLYIHPNMKVVFPEKSIKAIYKRGKNLKETLSPSSFPSTKNLIVGLISNCNSNSVNVVYLITRQRCKLQYVGSAITFKERFRRHRSIEVI